MGAQVNFTVCPCEDPVDEDDLETIYVQPQRSWRFTQFWSLYLVGQPAIYGERFIRTRLAEGAAAIKQLGSRW